MIRLLENCLQGQSREGKAARLSGSVRTKRRIWKNASPRALSVPWNGSAIELGIGVLQSRNKIV